ncbi:hypothetical protein ES332_D02G213600v1 [Gossypium tomentosum]|uniref:Uncharacterized protein n=1 Tax=Gossypium tomentosum TaxID=34277 RepID=A0A5D2M010_GOSTO|nr:hypothetical protein ES332_D02G213600v1 [Gossypium tomentosum]
MQSSQGPSVGFLMVRLHFHTALLHLNPLPKAICQILSPFFILPFASSCRFFCSSSITARPPAWMQKCSNASLKVRRNRSCSDPGSTKGPIVVMLDFKASPAMAMRSLDNDIPTLPSLSSSSNTHRRYLALRLSERRFDNRIAAPPMRKRQLGRSIALSFPW